MRLSVRVVVIVLCAVMVETALAQPATAPATLPADRSTPQGTLKQLAAAMQEGDRATMQAVLHAESDQERRVVESQIAQAAAFAAFRRAAIGAFGVNDANEITGDFTRAAADQIARIDSAAVKMDGDSATIELGPETVYVLRKGPDGWYVSIAGLLKDSRPDAINQIVRDMQDRTAVVQETADEMAAGNYKTTDEVAQAFQTKLLKLHLHRAAEASATQPADAPAPGPIEQR